MEIVGKLTPRSLGWDRNKLGDATSKVPSDGGKVLLGRIVGIVSGLKQTVNNDTGEVQNGLKGNFRGVSSRKLQVAEVNRKGEPVMKDGAPSFVDGPDPIIVTSGVCYLPGGIQEMIEGALAKAKEIDAKATVEFAIDLYGIPATNKAGYSFKADNIVEANITDPLAALLAAAERNTAPALAAPAAVDPNPDAETTGKTEIPV